jgi:hypothetical protein
MKKNTINAVIVTIILITCMLGDYIFEHIFNF